MREFTNCTLLFIALLGCGVASSTTSKFAAQESFAGANIDVSPNVVVVELVCNPSDVDMSSAAISTAELFVAAKYPDFDKSGKRAVARTIGDQWEVTYELPEGMLGGAPVVLVDKKTGRVIRSFRTQ